VAELGTHWVGVRGPGTAKFRRRFLEQELLEVSAVAIPANPNALALALKSGAVEKSDIKELSDVLRLTLEEKEAFHRDSNENSLSAGVALSSASASFSHLLPILKTINAVLKS